MKKRSLALLLVCVLLFGLMPMQVFALPPEAPVPGDTPTVKVGQQTGNLLKITTEQDFAAGMLSSLEPAPGVGNGALKLTDGAQRGEFISAVYATTEFEYLVATWNASIPEGASVEVMVRGYIVGTRDGASQSDWTSWLSYGPYGPNLLRSGTDDVDTAAGHGTNGWAYLDTDTFSVRGTSGATYVQLKAVLTRADGTAESPVLRQLSATTKNTNEGKQIPASYAETPYAGALPVQVENPAPGYSQIIRDPDIGGSICSPSTISVMLNSRNPALDLLPEEVALNVQDFNYGFGNWSYCVSGAGLYGYEAYAQYADKDILLQELAKGNTVGLSVNYSVKPGDANYLEGAYGSTPGHLITLVGYYYEDGHANDPAHLHFYSSDTYSAGDATSFHDYKWSQLDIAWKGRLAYIIPAQQPEAGAVATGVERVAATLEQNDAKTYKLMANGSRFDLTGFTTGKMSTLGRGVLAYTIEGVRTDMKKDQRASAVSTVYSKALQMTANETFFYTGLGITDGNLEFNANVALANAGVAVGETRTITVYAIANNGYAYRAATPFTRTAAPLVTLPIDPVPTNYGITVTVDNGVVCGRVSSVETARVGVRIPDGADLAHVRFYAGTVPFSGTLIDRNVEIWVVVDGTRYLELPLSAELLAAGGQMHSAIDWADGTGIHLYRIDLSEVIRESAAVQKDGNLVSADLASGILRDAICVAERGITLSPGSTEGRWISPAYRTTLSWEYMMGTLSAVTPGASSAELMVRAKTQQGGWSGWYSWGMFGSGMASMSASAKDAYVNLDTDVFSIRGASATANATHFQLKVVLRADAQGNSPTLFGVSSTYKKAAYSASEAVYSGKTDAGALPERVMLEAEAYSASSYHPAFSSWRFENMMLMLLNSRGADLLFEEVALNGYDFNGGWGNWAYTVFKAGLFGHNAYTQYGATPTLIRQALADGNAVGLFVNGTKISIGDQSSSRQIVVYGYETVDGVVTFRYISASADPAGTLFGSCTEAQLSTAISGCSSTSARGAMYVIGSKIMPKSSVQRRSISAATSPTGEYRLSTGALPTQFIQNADAISGQGGVLAYTLKSELLSGKKLAAQPFHYDAAVNAQGGITLPEAIVKKIAEGDSAMLYVICNNGITYVAPLYAYIAPQQSYTVTALPAENGTIRVTPTAQPGVEVGITLTPAAGYHVSHVSVKSGSTERKTVTSADGTVWFTMPSADVTVSAVFAPDAPTEFSDVPAGRWYASAVYAAVERGLIDGVSAGRFAPEALLTRAEAVETLWRMAGKPNAGTDCTFTDAGDPKGAHAAAIAWACQEKLISGYPDKTFRPAATVTRQELAVMLYRFAAYRGVLHDASDDLNRFVDAGDVAPWALDGVRWSVAQALLLGRENHQLEPEGTATRAEFAAVLMRYIERIK